MKWIFPEVHPLKGENAALKALRFGSPLYILREEKKYGHLRNGIAEPQLSDYASAIAADTIRRHKPDFSTIHFIDLDEARHHHGTFSDEATAALDRNDGRLQDLWQAIIETPGMEDALLIAVSDHGQEDIRDSVLLTRKLEEAGFGRQLTVQSNGMSAYFFPGPEYLADFDPAATFTEEQLQAWGISRLYTRADLDAMHAVAGPVFAAEAAEGVVFSDALDEEKREAATHGFGPGREADQCLFAVYGKGVKQGSEIPSMHMRDVGPTIAGLMGLELPQADGTDLSALFLG